MRIGCDKINAKLMSLVLWPALSFLGCGEGAETAPGTNHDHDIAHDSTKVVAVETYRLTEGGFVDQIEATGTVFPRITALVSSQTQGTAIDVLVEIGDNVSKGQLMVQVDDELKRFALEQAEAKLLEAKAAFEKASKDFERNKKLHETNDISDYVFDNARLQKQSAEAIYQAALAQVKIAKRQLTDTRIVSPIDGIVSSVSVEVGNTVAPGTPVAQVVDISEVTVKFGVPQKDVGRVQKGRRAIITVDAFGEKSFEGVVSAIGPQADLGSRSFPVEVSVANSQGLLRGGMIARVSVLVEEITNATLLPKSAILERTGKTVIFVIEDGVARQRVPRLGKEQDDSIVLLGGAHPGEEVVVSGLENLRDGALVRAKQSAANFE